MSIPNEALQKVCLRLSEFICLGRILRADGQGSGVPIQFGLTQPPVSLWFPIENINSNEGLQMLIISTNTAPPRD